MNRSTGALWVARVKTAPIQQQQTQKNVPAQGKGCNPARQKQCALAGTEPITGLLGSAPRAGGARQKLLHTSVVCTGS